MELGWECSEKLAALSLGCVGLAIGDPGLMAGSAISGVGLLAAWRQARACKGFESEQLLAKVRKEVREGFEVWSRGREFDEADVRAADLAMAEHLIDCVPDATELAKMAFENEDFPPNVARLVVDRLSQRNPIFASEGLGASFSRTRIRSDDATNRLAHCQRARTVHAHPDW